MNEVSKAVDLELYDLFIFVESLFGWSLGFTDLIKVYTVRLLDTKVDFKTKRV